MTRIQDIIARAEPLIDRKFYTATPAAFTTANAYNWIHDSYKKIADLVRIPRKSITLYTTDLEQEYYLPEDCYDGVDGVISVEYDGNPIKHPPLSALMSTFGHDWKNPQIKDGNTLYWTEYEKYNVIFLTPLPANEKELKIIYVALPSVPSDPSDLVPKEFERFVPDIPLYVAGRAMEGDKQARGAAFISEFESRILRGFRRKERRGRRVGGDAYAQNLNAYHNCYGRVNRK